VIRKRLRDWLLAQTQSFRKARMQAFVREFQPTPTMRILDIGGTDLNWRIIDQPARVVLLNTKMPEGGHDLALLGTEYGDAETGGPSPGGQRGNTEYVLGDGRSVPYADGEFDICFSNSTIEHLSRLDEQRRFAHEVRRVGHGVWLQTPARRFPFEPHWLSPFVHWLPTPRAELHSLWMDAPTQQGGRVRARGRVASPHLSRDAGPLPRLRDPPRALPRPHQVLHRRSPHLVSFRPPQRSSPGPTRLRPSTSM
jgi:Methyltransferase domain